MRGELQLPQLALLEQGQPLLRLRNLAATGENVRGVAGLRLGEGSLTLEEASITYPDLDRPLRIRGMEAQAQSGRIGDSTGVFDLQRIGDARPG